MRTHHRNFFPRFLWRQDRLVAHSFPRDSVGAGRVTDPRMAPGLAGVPHVIDAFVFDNHGTVDVVFPGRFLSRTGS